VLKLDWTKRIATGIAAIAMTTMTMAPAAQGEEAVWRSLPDSTIAAVQVPRPAEAMAGLRANTRIGQLLYSEEQINKYFEAAMAEVPEDAREQMRTTLGELNLEPADLTTLMSGAMGAAVMLEPREGQMSLPIFALWVNPGEDLGRRLIAAIEAGYEKRPEDQRPKRIDEEIAGEAVIRFTMPIEQPGAMRPMELPEGFGEMSQEEQQAAMGEAMRAVAETAAADAEVVDQTHVLISRQGGRILLVASAAASRDSVAAGGDIDAATGLPLVQRAMAELLEGAEAGGRDAFASRIMALPGFAEALPGEGVTMIEIAADLSPLWAMGRAEAMKRRDGERVWKIVEDLGLTELKQFAARQSMNGNIVEGGAILGLPAERRGLLRILDQPATAMAPEAWTPADVINYAVLGLDLGAAYKVVREEVMKQLEPAQQQQFTASEQQVQQTLGADMPTVLSALGRRHVMLDFGVKMVELPMGPGAAEPTAFPLAAYVWSLERPELWQNVLGIASGMAMAGGVQLNQVNQQGFMGMKLGDQMPVDASLALGKGKLMLTMGDTLDQVITAVASPPEGTGALVNAEWYKQAAELIKPRPAMAYVVTNAKRQLTEMMPAYKQMFETAAKRDGDMEELYTAVQRVLEAGPSLEEVAEAAGYGVQITEVKPEGVVVESRAYLPPAA